MSAALAAGVLLAAAVLIWPARPDPTAVLVPTPDEATPPTRPRPWRLLGAERAREADDKAVLEFIEALAAALRAGLTPAGALAAAAEASRMRGATLPWVPGLELRARTGEGLGAAWSDVADRADSPPIRLLARAWALSDEVGAPLAGATETAARLIRQDRDRRRAAQSAVAGARATINVLTVLPVAGPLLAAVMGVDLARLYADSPTVWACLGAGLGLMLIGRAWVARLVVAALHGPVLS